MRNILWGICLGVLFTGCAQHSEPMKAWVGHSETELLSEWGAPDKSVTLDNGRTIHTWLNEHETRDSGTACKKNFVVNHYNIVTDENYRNCNVNPLPTDNFLTM